MFERLRAVTSVEGAGPHVCIELFFFYNGMAPSG